MVRPDKHAFWQALIITIIVFNIGLGLGILLENIRTKSIRDMYIESDIGLLDIRIQENIYSTGTYNCEEAINENIKFADRVYEEAKLLIKYEQSNKITEGLIEQHKKYDLLRTLFWLNSIKLKKDCNASFHTIVYLYMFDIKNPEIRAKQNTFSNFLSSLKEEKGNEIMLIPIAANFDLSSINLMLNRYNITEFPTVLIDEKTRISSIEELNNIKQYIF